jgi:hypothetical protein
MQLSWDEAHEKSGIAPEWQVVVWGFLLNTVWEFGHSPLYTDHTQGWNHVIWSRLHCTVGDVMILLSCFWFTSLCLRTRRWPLRRPIAGTALFVSSGLGYTIFSEWWNTAVRKTWTYSDTMPVVYDIGLSPILQWLVIPLSLVSLMHRQLATHR